MDKKKITANCWSRRYEDGSVSRSGAIVVYGDSEGRHGDRFETGANSRTNWDKAEDYGGDTALSKTNHGLFDQIDKAMDQFINLVEHAGATPDLNAIKAAYNAYLDKLKLAD